MIARHICPISVSRVNFSLLALSRFSHRVLMQLAFASDVVPCSSLHVACRHMCICQHRCSGPHPPALWVFAGATADHISIVVILRPYSFLLHGRPFFFCRRPSFSDLSVLLAIFTPFGWFFDWILLLGPRHCFGQARLCIWWYCLADFVVKVLSADALCLSIFSARPALSVTVAVCRL